LVSIPSVAQVSMPSAFTPEIMAASLGTSRSFRSRQAAPMQKRWAPPALACMASAMTLVASISLEAFTPVSKEADWLQ
jgi:hypothetical protein